MRKQGDFLFEAAKQEFLQSGKTIPELLKEKGYTPWYGGNWMAPDAHCEMCSMSQENALQQVLKNWFN